MSLTIKQIETTKAEKGKRKTLSDGRGLLLEIHPSGSKFWIVRYYPEKNGKEHRKHIGNFPDMSIIEAREITQQIKKQAREGELNTAGQQGNALKATTFKNIADEWFDVKIKSVRSAVYVEKTRIRLDKHLIPNIGHLEISEISARQILEICKRIEAVGHTETARRIKRIAGAVFNYAIASDRAKNNPTSALSGALTPPTVKHYATITDEEGIANLIKNSNFAAKNVT